MDFILTEINDPGNRILLPVNPTEVSVSEGARTQSFDVIELGGVALARGRQPVRISWEGTLFGIDRQGYVQRLRERFVEPEFVIAMFQMWLNYNRHIRINVTDTNVQWPRLFVNSLNHSRAGAYGDIRYSIELTEVRPFMVRLATQSEDTEELEAEEVTSADEVPVDAGNPAAEEAPTEYQVRPGDSLWAIAKQTYGDGSRWHDIYAANRDVIGPDPNQISPGQSLRIPGGTPPKSE